MSTVSGLAPVQADDVWQIVAEVWESLLGVPAVRADHAFRLDGAVTASVRVHGDWSGLVTVTVPKSTAAALTRTMLQLRDDEVESDEDVFDAVGEIVNVIGGNVKALLHGSTSLGLPVVDVEWAPVHAQLVCRTGAEWPGHVARISVWRVPNGAGRDDANEGAGR